ncbi:amino acid adenylation domain-containing protein, partial [Pseudoalteromonas fuliginea]|uniref:amino acid adenylation domain-containing protein n=1 Tax=Pseudoalteromonas fuliginea TaxID=1872678 RepID=UPI00316F8A0A
NVVELLEVERDRARHPIYQVMFSVQRFGDSITGDASLLFEKMNLLESEGLFSPAKFDLSLLIADGQASISGRLNYALSLFEVRSIERLLGLYERVLTAIVSEKYNRIADIPMLSDQERQQQLIDYNNTYSPNPANTSLHSLFETQVAAVPKHVAVSFGSESITYVELNQRANFLAHRLRDNYKSLYGQPMPAETIIGIYLERSIDMVVGLLAILKAGGAYVPISSELPEQRVSFMLSDTKAPMVLTQAPYETKLKKLVQNLAIQPQVLLIEQCGVEYSKSDLALSVNSEHLAYVIYTSGTTGKPKGVLIEHRGIVNTITDNAKAIDVQSNSVFFQNTSLNFDAATWVIFVTLSRGASICLSDNSSDLCAQINAHKVSHLMMTPSMLKLLEPYDVPCVSHVTVAGEACDEALKEKWVDKVCFYNAYGPTESSICATIKQLMVTEKVSIGGPIRNASLYVLDEQQALVPSGVVGELYIGGMGVARGYLNLEALTASKFIENPYYDGKVEGSSQRIYRTGDLVRWLSTGELEYIGRIDSQVKIRGVRIELDEIASVLMSLEGIQQAVVFDVQKHGTQFLVAYFVTEQSYSVTLANVEERLRQCLPDYMLPGSLVEVDLIPLTVNGKLDKAALPEPELIDKSQYVAPRNDFEKSLCEVWQTVLGLELVGIYDNFFHIGGNSIMAIKLTQVSRRELDMDIPLTKLFEHKTIAGLTANLSTEPLVVIPKTNLTRAPLSFAQESLLFIEKFESGSHAYHVPHLIELNDTFNVSNLQQALDVVVKQHPILTTVYLEDEFGEAYQEILDVGVNINTHELASEEQLHQAIAEVNRTPFDLSKELSIRVHYYLLKTQRYILFVWHHIAFDGWSVNIFMEALAKAYSSVQQSLPVEQSEPELRYLDYAVWQKEKLKGNFLEKAQAYWQAQLSDFEELELPLDYPRPKQFNYEGKDHFFTLDAELSSKLRIMAKEQSTTLYTVLLSAFYITLARYSGQQDIILGTPSENREQAQVQSLIGFFVNSLPLRAHVDFNDSVEKFVGKVHHIVTQGKIYQKMPFEKIVDTLDVKRDPAKHPIFQAFFRLQQFTQNNNEVFPVAFETHQLLHSYSPAKFDLDLFLNDDGSTIFGGLNYAVTLFKVQSIECIVQMYRRILQGFVHNAKTRVSELRYLSRVDIDKFLNVWNQSAEPVFMAGTLHKAFEEQVDKTPKDTALVFNGETLNYEELNCKANVLANRIRTEFYAIKETPIESNQFVALYLDRSLEMVISILAVLKAGAAYVPIAPEHGVSRMQFILHDTQAPLLLSQSWYGSKLRENLADSDLCCNILEVDQIDYLDKSVNHNFDEPCDVDDLAYIIYTSGTTGTPKGVKITHGASTQRNYCIAGLSKSKRNSYLFKTNYIFDVSVSDLFSHLMVGATIHITKSSFDPQEIDYLCSSEPVNAAHFVPSQFNAYLSLCNNDKPFERIYFSGENLTKEQLLLIDFDRTDVINYYGPTETGEATFHEVTNEQEQGIIGRPLAGVEVYVLQPDLGLSPVNVPGELFIGGIGLAQGYLNLPELTAERFIDNPFKIPGSSNHKKSLLYKTGDIVRWSADGKLQYLGRNDDQVKVRGYRIELGEIESALVFISSIEQAVVVLHESDYLCAYVVAKSQLDIDAVQAELSSTLPEHMLPNGIMQLPEIPLTINGKLDKEALPRLTFNTDEIDVAPRSELERQLCLVWQKALEVMKVGIHDNYFQIGGNSIKALKLGLECRRQLNIDMPLPLLFEKKTIAKIVPFLDETSTNVILRSNLQSPPLSFAQERLWFIERFNEGVDTYHIPHLAKLNCAIDMVLLEEAINMVVSRHDVLKTTYREDESGQGYQYKLDQRVTIHKEQSSNIKELEHSVTRLTAQPFDLKNDLAIRVHHFLLEEQQYILIVWHHIAFDGWSIGLFNNEVALAYSALYKGNPVQLPDLSISYSDYAIWQRDNVSGDTLNRLLNYWKEQLVGYEQLNLITDHIRPSHFDYRGGDLKFTLDDKVSSLLREFAKANETTLYSVLLSGFYLTISALSGQKDIVIGTPSDNRHHSQVQPLIGFFVNTLPLRVCIQQNDLIEALVAQVHNLVTQGKANQDLPFEKIVDVLEVERDTSCHPIFQIMFALDNSNDSAENNTVLPWSKVPLPNTVNSPAKFDLNLVMTDGQASISGQLNYALSLFEVHSIERLLGLYTRVLTGLVSGKYTCVGELPLLSDAERDTLLCTLNDTDKAYPQGQTLAELFSAQAHKTP